MTPRTLDRREFLTVSGTVGAGLLIGFRALDAESLAAIDTSAADFAPSGYLRVGSDGIITLFADHVELGQGVMTALPMIVAEELDADWSKVRIERMPDDPSAWPRRIMTVGSQSVRTSWAPLRKAGATAREMLISAAAASWSVDRAACRSENGFVVHAASGRRASYGDLASAAASMPVPSDPPLKDPKTFRIVGTKRPRVDIPSKTNGSAQYGIDVRVPGMLVATVLRPPVLGGPSSRSMRRRPRRRLASRMSCSSRVAWPCWPSTHGAPSRDAARSRWSGTTVPTSGSPAPRFASSSLRSCRRPARHSPARVTQPVHSHQRRMW